MAGIGFRLQAMVQQGTVLESAGAYLSSAFISSGPWLSGVGALAALAATSSTYLSVADHSLLFATIVSTYAASILVAAGPQMLVTRYLADCLYRKSLESIAPTCGSMCLLVLPFALLALPFVVCAPFDLRYRLLVTTLFLVLSMTWMVTACLSASQRYLRITLIFALCALLGVSASRLLGTHYGLPGSLSGFTFAQLLCLLLLIASIYQEFPSSQALDFAYLAYFKKYWDLFLVGVIYALGCWVDILLFWMSAHSQVIDGFYHFFSPYDTARLLANLATIPAAVIFMIHVETNFYRHYERYYRCVQKGTLNDMARSRMGMQQASRSGAWLILKVQALFALFLCLLAPYLAQLTNLPVQWVPLLRTAIMGGTGQFFVFFMVLLLLYLDRRRAALLLVCIFATCNCSLTFLSLLPGETYFGMGYLAATIISAVLGWILFNNRLQRLDYLTFMRPL